MESEALKSIIIAGIYLIFCIAMAMSYSNKNNDKQK